MIDYDNAERINPILGGITTASILWEGRQTQITIDLTPKGLIQTLTVTYAMPDDEFKIATRTIKTNNGTVLFELATTWQGKRIKTQYLSGDITEDSFNRAFNLTKQYCQRKATAELITRLLPQT